MATASKTSEKTMTVRSSGATAGSSEPTPPRQQRISLPLTEDLVMGLADFFHETRQKSRVVAANELLKLGLREAGKMKVRKGENAPFAVEREAIRRATKPTIPFNVDLLQQVKDFRYRPEIRIDTETAAIRTLLRLGLVTHQKMHPPRVETKRKSVKGE